MAETFQDRLARRTGSREFEATPEDQYTVPHEGQSVHTDYSKDPSSATFLAHVPGENTEGYQPYIGGDDTAELPAITGGRLGRRRRIIRWLHNMLFRVNPMRKKSQEELMYEADLKARKAHEKELLRQAIEAERRIITALVEIGARYEYRGQKEGGVIPNPNAIQRPRFAEVRFSEEAIFLRFQTPLPRDVRPEMILHPDTLTAVSAHVRRRVTSHFKPEEGMWYVVELSAGVRGIPRHVQFMDMMERFPKSADGLYIPFGQAANRKPVYLSMGSFHHMLLGGQTGSGKSNFLEVMLCSLLRRNKPEYLRLILIDLKRGVQLSRYKGVPHLVDDIQDIPAGIITDREHVVPALRWLHAEGERRLDRLQETGYQDIGGYNSRHHTHNKMSHIVAVFDEIADLMMDKEIKKDAETLMANILGRHRAAGIHLILCTQNPRTQVIDGLVKANCPLRMAFSVPSMAASMVILDNGKAANLGSIPGRAVVSFKDEIELQVPLITNEIAQSIIEGTKTGEFKEIATAHDVTPMEIMQWSLENMNLQGKLPFRSIFAQFGPRGLTQEELLLWLKSWENQEFIIGSTKYIVVPGSGSRSRMLQAVREETPDKNMAQSKL